MNRRVNPYRNQHHLLRRQGDEAAGRGDYAESMRLWNEAARLKAKGVAELATQPTRAEVEALAARLAGALAGIVAVLGPDRICGCDFPSGCGLPDEAEEALKIAKNALGAQ